jgi:hypothetical protein
MDMRQVDSELLIAYLLAELGVTRDEAEAEVILMTSRKEENAEQEA